MSLTWYINPDNGGQKTLAEQCSEASGGAYTITTQILPNEADAQREQLVRRLAAGDESVDLMSLDPPFVAEFANAGYLQADHRSRRRRAAHRRRARRAAWRPPYWDGELVATPFWANTQLLWYRKSVAQAAGVDPAVARPSPGTSMIDAAESQEQEDRGAGQALRGLHGVDQRPHRLGRRADHRPTPTRATRPSPTVASPAGDAAAEVVGTLASLVGGTRPTCPPPARRRPARCSRATHGVVHGQLALRVHARRTARSTPARSTRRSSTTSRWARYPAMARRPAERAAPRRHQPRRSATSPSTPTQALDAVKCITSRREQRPVHGRSRATRPPGPRRTTTRRCRRPSRWPT